MEITKVEFLTNKEPIRLAEPWRPAWRDLMVGIRLTLAFLYINLYRLGNYWLRAKFGWRSQVASWSEPISHQTILA